MEFRAGKQPGLLAVDRFLANNPAQYVSAALDLCGPVSTINNACTSGVDAIGQAREWIRDGLCDMAIAGGTDELSRIPYLGFSSLLNTSELPCRPFDLKRDGLNLGEGAGVLIMESRAAARARGAKALVEVAGYGTCGDAYHPTAPHPQGVGLEQAIRRALDRITPGEIGFINAHGTATTANDQVEGSTFARVFGPQVTVFGSKGYTGHTLGAAGAIEAIFTAQGLLMGEIPATAGFSEADPDCVIVPTRALTKVKGDHALSTSLAFGGNNSALLLKLCK
jgi:3-oxoacyl-(acyl-carrier-protein) synthase